MEILVILLDVLETSGNVVVLVSNKILLGSRGTWYLFHCFQGARRCGTLKPFAQAAPQSTMAAQAAQSNYHRLLHARAGSPCMAANQEVVFDLNVLK